MSESPSDHWLLRDDDRSSSHHEAEVARGCLVIEEYAEVEPLDTQFGVLHKLSAPEVFQKALFGPLDAEDAGPDRGLFAIVDAAKLPYFLTGLIEASDLEYISLFDGAAQLELEDHAPYLIRLKEDNPFTRSLFTKSDRPDDLWGLDICILFRSTAKMKALRKHFRHFTRVQDEDGKWFFFRFWEPRVLAYYLRTKQHAPLDVGRWFYGADSLKIDSYILAAERGSYSISGDSSAETAMRQSIQQKFLIDEDVKRMWRDLSHFEFIDQLQTALLNDPDTGEGANPLRFKDFVTEQVGLARTAGITLEGAISDVVTAACLLKSGLSGFPPDMAALLNHKRLPQMSRAKKLKQMARKIHAERERS